MEDSPKQFFGVGKKSKEDVIRMNREIDNIGKEYYEKTGDQIEEEIRADFRQTEYDKQKTFSMMELVKKCIRDNPRDLFENLKLREFSEVLSDIYSSRKYKDREEIDQLLRDIDVYKTTHSEEVNEEMTVDEFLRFLFELGAKASFLLEPKE